LYDAPEPLAEEGTWQAFLDEETTGLIYYFDTKTGESLWEPPTSTFPEVRLPRRKQRLADNLRREYRKARQQEMIGTTDDNSYESSGTGVAEVEEEQQPQQPSWIEGIFDSKEEEVVEEAPPQEQRDWFKFFDGAGKKDQEVQTEKAKAEQKWFSGVFGGGVTEQQQRQETPTQEEGRKLRILESFASFSSPPQETSAPVEVQKKVVEKKVVEKKVVEKKVVVEEKPKPKKREEKIEDYSPKPIKIEMGSHILPHPAKVRWGGEDAVFTKGRTFGVFDGVSGADKLDGVPLYSRTLASEMKKMVGTEGVTVQEMTNYLTSAAAYADGAATGASTAVVASIGENGFLQALNVGDSYCIVVRDGKITAKTREISHYWECPYQLSEDSPDRPRDGTKLNVELVPGDIIIMGSDGVFDNVDDDMLLDLIAKSPAKATALAKKICDLSRKQYMDKNSETPYAKQAQRRGDPDYRSGLGGKVDDVSCVVVVCK
jgi:protein phosphatase PTC7